MIHEAPLSAGNARVKDARRLSRRSVRTERRLFLADGPKAVEAALEPRPGGAGDGGAVVEVFATPAATEHHPALVAAARSAGAAWTLVDERALAGLSDSVTPAGVVAVCRSLDVPLEVALAGSPRLVVVAVEVREPGNAGTLVRCADAVGADAVVLAGEAVDVHNPKTVRASVGSVFHLPVAVEPDPRRALEAVRAAGLQVLATAGGGELDLFAADDLLEAPTAWVLGNEAHGLPDDLAVVADHRVSIPILGRAESLNLATAAAVCLYASARAQSR